MKERIIKTVDKATDEFLLKLYKKLEGMSKEELEAFIKKGTEKLKHEKVNK